MGRSRKGLYLEYEVAWTSGQAARSVASFANSYGGGTLVVGVEAHSLKPTGLVPIAMGEGELAEAAVSVLGSWISRRRGRAGRSLGRPTPARSCSLRIEIIRTTTGTCSGVRRRTEGGSWAKQYRDEGL